MGLAPTHRGDALGRDPRYLLRDRDRAYGGDFVSRARRIGIEVVLTPIASPQANAIAERLVGTLRRECLDHLIIVNARHLRAVRTEFVHHYNDGRPHRALELAVPRGPGRWTPYPESRVIRRRVLAA